MDHASALRDLGVTSDLLSPQEKAQLDAEGWLVRESAFGPTEASAMHLAVERLLYEQRLYGMETPPEPGAEMIFGITPKDPAFATILLSAFAWAVADHVFRGAPFHGGNSNFRSPLPGMGLQAIHSDMPPCRDPGAFQAVQTVFAAGPITKENGATRVVPGSHLWGQVAHEVLDNPLLPVDGEIYLEAPAGSVIAFNANLWHGGTTNRTMGKRYALFGTIRRLDEERQAAPVPPTLAHLPEAATYLMKPEVAPAERVNAPMPCWCCGIQRTCCRSVPVDPSLLERLPDGRLLLSLQETSTFGVADTGVS